ncbi:MAG: hypothetical protein JWR19_2191 [Pedosphaera sp.]|nr:hypothetical protein [Pedosphaera sp.]
MSDDIEQQGQEQVEITCVQRLICAIIYQAVEDYKLLERERIVEAGRLVAGGVERHKEGGSRHTLIGRGMKTENDARAVLVFLKRDMDDLIDGACIPLNPRAVRAKLGIPNDSKAATTIADVKPAPAKVSGLLPAEVAGLIVRGAMALPVPEVKRGRAKLTPEQRHRASIAASTRWRRKHGENPRRPARTPEERRLLQLASAKRWRDRNVLKLALQKKPAFDGGLGRTVFEI